MRDLAVRVTDGFEGGLDLERSDAYLEARFALGQGPRESLTQARAGLRRRPAGQGPRGRPVVRSPESLRAAELALTSAPSFV